MRGTTLGIVVLMLVGAGSPVAARDSAPLQVGAVTVLAGEQPRRFEVEVTASNAAIDLAMVDREGQVLPAGLSVHGGSGFRGFLLTERGHFDGLVVVALQLPETDHRTDGSIVHGIGWGQTADGQPCTRCEIPAGTYDLHLLAGGVPFGPEEQEWGSTEVTMLVENAEGTVTLGPDDGEPLFAFQQSGRADHVGHAGLVLDVDEHGAAGSGGLLAVGDHPGDPHGTAVRHLGEIGRRQHPGGGRRRRDPRRRASRRRRFPPPVGQAWAAAAPLLWLRSILRLAVGKSGSRLSIDPHLLPGMEGLRLDGLKIRVGRHPLR